MSRIHVLNADGSDIRLEERRVQEKLRRGLLAPETFYWKEGMPEWRPLRELPVLHASAPLQPETQIAHYHFTKNPEPLTTLVKVMLVGSILLAILILFIGIESMSHLFARDFKGLNVYTPWIRLLDYFSWGASLLTAIPFLMWIYRANLNCRGFGCQLKFTPGMAVASYFIPFADLVYPCMAMQEIWKASRDPAHWRLEKASVLVGFWWAFWLMCKITALVGFYSPRPQVVDGLQTEIFKLKNMFSILIALEISKIILCILAFAMINVITSRQKDLTV